MIRRLGCSSISDNNSFAHMQRIKRARQRNSKNRLPSIVSRITHTQQSTMLFAACPHYDTNRDKNTRRYYEPIIITRRRGKPVVRCPHNTTAEHIHLRQKRTYVLYKLPAVNRRRKGAHTRLLQQRSGRYVSSATAPRCRVHSVVS